MRSHNTEAIEANLSAAFTDVVSGIPLGVRANYLARAHVSLVQWWLEKRQPYSAEKLAQSFQSLLRAALREAFGV